MEIDPDESDTRPLYGRRRQWMLRTVVIVGVVSLVLPSVLSALNLATSTAEGACAAAVRYSEPTATGMAVPFEVFGPGGIGWECYAIGGRSGDHHVVSLGLFPSNPTR